ncbi:MAG: hypothetical protein Q9187_007595, partial [Circinaria calcarea]
KRPYESVDLPEKKQKVYSCDERSKYRINSSNPSHRDPASGSANPFDTPKANGHKANKSSRNNKTPDRQLTASLDQQTSETPHNLKQQNGYACPKGENVDEAALNFGQGHRSGQSKSFNYDTDNSSHPEKGSESVQVLSSPSQSITGQTSYPDLPPILDHSLADVPFTHAGTLNGKPDSSIMSYDRLEFVGDAYIELMATRLTYSLYPKLSVGRWSQIRESLVRNDTLAEFSLVYGFDERAKIPRSHRDMVSHTHCRPGGNKMGKGFESRKLWTKLLGDIFEAYVAAVILSDPLHGFNTVEAWLTMLWSSKLQGEDHINNLALDLGAKQDLARKVLGRGIKLEYQDEAVPEVIKREGKIWYMVGVYLTGWGWENQYLGSGKGLNKSEAGNRAAMQALRNPLTAQIGAIKRDFDAKAKLEKEQQSSNTVIGEAGVKNAKDTDDLNVKSEANMKA